MPLRVRPDDAARLGEFLKKQESVEDRWMVGANQGTSPIGGIFKTFIFTNDAAHAREAVEIPGAVGAYFLPRRKGGCVFSPSGGIPENGCGQPSGAEKMQTIGRIDPEGIAERSSGRDQRIIP